jgi:hypothetical protein
MRIDERGETGREGGKGGDGNGGDGRRGPLPRGPLGSLGFPSHANPWAPKGHKCFIRSHLLDFSDKCAFRAVSRVARGAMPRDLSELEVGV